MVLVNAKQREGSVQAVYHRNECGLQILSFVVRASHQVSCDLRVGLRGELHALCQQFGL